jgi:hypothetical protein
MADPVSLAMPRLATEEGFRAYMYTLNGLVHIGYGCNLSAGWSKGLAQTVLQYQLTQIYASVKQYPWWHDDEPVRGSVILDLGMNNGLGGLLHFVNMLSAYGKKDWKGASEELLNSLAAKELPARYHVLSQLLLTGAM